MLYFSVQKIFFSVHELSKQPLELLAEGPPQTNCESSTRSLFLIKPTMEKYLLFILSVCVFGCFGMTLIAQEDNTFSSEVSLDSLLNIKISTASKYEQLIGEAPASVTIVTSGDIERYGYRTLSDILDHEKGFYTSYDRNYNYVGVRGFGRPSDYNNRLLLLYDGHPINENVYGSASIGTDFPIAIEQIEHIEIVRGPGSALYGTGAMFAVINVITKKGNTIDGTRLSAEIGSFGRRQGSFQFGKEWESAIDFSLSGIIADNTGEDLYYQEYDNPATNRGIAQGLDWDKYFGFYSRVSYDNIFVNGYLTQRSKGTPSGMYDNNFNDGRAKTIDNFAGINARYDAKVTSALALSGTLGYQYYYYSGDFPIQDLQVETAIGKRICAEVRMQLDIQPEHRLTIGSEYNNNIQSEIEERNAGIVYYDGDYPNTIFSIYVEDEYQIFNNFFLTLGVRHDRYSSVGSATTPRGALVYSFFDRQSTLKFLYGEGFRAPSSYESYYTDSLSYYKDNPNLHPENIHTCEIVFEQRLSEAVQGTISYYYYDMDNLIDVWIDPSDLFYQYKNLEDVIANGFEAELKIRLDGGFQGKVNYAYQRAENDQTGEKLSNSPQHIANVGFSYPFNSAFTAGMEFQYQSERLTVYGTNTPAFFLSNIHLRVQQKNGRLGAGLFISNVFNESYSHPASLDFKQAGIPQDGRSFKLNVWLKF